MKSKLKYYINPILCKMVIASFIIAIAIVQSVSGATLSDASAIPNKIFKCQPATIYANFSESAAVTGVKVYLDNKNNAMANGTLLNGHTVYVMANIAPNQWSAAYGNDNTLVYGDKTITIETTEGAIITNHTTNASIVVYSDPCTGTGMQSYQNLTNHNLGNYTSRLFNSDISMLSWVLIPWIEYWGYVFYVLVIFTVCLSIYMKTQNVIQPMLIGFMSFAALAGTNIVPPEYKQWILLVLGAAIGIICWRAFLKERY